MSIEVPLDLFKEASLSYFLFLVMTLHLKIAGLVSAKPMDCLISKNPLIFTQLFVQRNVYNGLLGIKEHSSESASVKRGTKRWPIRFWAVVGRHLSFFFRKKLQMSFFFKIFFLKIPCFLLYCFKYRFLLIPYKRIKC